MKRTRRKSRSKISGPKEAKRPELLAMAKSFGIRSRHRMTKKELIRALEPHIKKSPGQWKDGRAEGGKRERGEEGIFERHSQPAPPSPEIPKKQGDGDLPWSYGETELILMSVDPFLIHAYWDFSPKDWEEIQGKQEKVVLRIYDVTMIDFNGTNAHHFFDIPVTPEARNWYIPVWSAEKSLCADLGWPLPDGSFRLLSRSNVVQTPRAGVSIFEETRWLEVRLAKGKPGRKDILKGLRLRHVIIPWKDNRDKRPPFWNSLIEQTVDLTKGERGGLSSSKICQANKIRNRA